MAYTREGETRGKVFQFVRERILAGRPPTVREVQEAFGFHAVDTAYRHLENLVAEGKLGREAGKARGYRLPEARGIRYVPLLGRVQAGVLTTAVQEPEGYIPVSPQQTYGELFALRVEGLSMKDAGILPGDIAIVRRQPRADSGDIVVALVGDEATVKRLRLNRRRIELHAENPDFLPIIPPPGEVIILGKVIETRRYYELVE
ncbi:MAG: LexA repressor [Syntrophorhabdaceae bacterium PtaU1.Bin034]|nr:MAG: LexA repressor [Syntrophorhabdaceae bacterium PtaU1.Bin034]